jgi:hypothetical protein
MVLWYNPVLIKNQIGEVPEDPQFEFCTDGLSKWTDWQKQLQHALSEETSLQVLCTEQYISPKQESIDR